MTTRPILFDGEMVRAILDARKNQTRRPIESVLGIGRVRDFGPVDRPRSFDWAMRDRRGLWHEMMHDELLARCPYGQRGDRLYVRETVRADEWFAPLHVVGGAIVEQSLLFGEPALPIT
jgi:hypothetical protein